MAGFAFEETNDAAAEITRLFDFIWPTAIALWNLRWQVAGFLSVVPQATHDDVAARFVVGSDIRGADIRAMHQNVTWDEQKARFAEFVLTNIFAIYESWARRLVDVSKLTGMSDRDLFTVGDGVKRGLSVFISRANATTSPAMQSALLPAFRAHKKVHAAQLDNMLKCYRYFKEIRNCHIHNGGVADQKTVEAYSDFQPISSASALNTKEQIQHYPAVLGAKTGLSLRGVVGFCDIVLRMMVTLDAEISGSSIAERVIVERIRVSRGPLTPTLSSDPRKVAHLMKRLCRNANLPPPHSVDDLCQLFLRHRIVSR